MTPPRWARLLVRWSAHPDDRDFQLADLEEDFRRIAARRDERAARRWYAGQALASLGPNLVRRLEEVRVPGALADLGQDVRIALRSYLRRPGFTAAAVSTLAVAVGANAAVVSLANGALLAPLPGVGDPAGLVEISRELDGDWFDVAWPIVERIDRDAGTVRDVAGFELEPMAVAREGRPRVVVGLSVSASYFPTLAVEPGEGRFFAPDEAGFPAVRPVAVVSHHLWSEELGAPAPGAATIRVNGTTLDLVGVGPPGFRGHLAVPVDVFVPLGLPLAGVRDPEVLRRADSGAVEILARLSPGATVVAAQEELSALADAVHAEAVGPGAEPYRMRIVPWGRIPGPGRGPVTLFLVGLLAVVALVLATACVNVAGMMLARSAERRDEIAMRLALGAGRTRLVRQLLTEALVLAAAAGGLGVLVGSWGASLLLRLRPPLPPGFQLELDAGLDVRVVGATLAVTFLAVVASHLAPALYAARTDVAASLKGGRATAGRARTRGRSLLVGAQLALSTALLVVAGLFGRALTSLERMDAGWSVEDVLVTELDFELTGATPDQAAAVWTELRRRASGLPGTEAAGLAGRLPLTGLSSLGGVSVDGVPPPQGRTGFQAHVKRVSPGYFGALGIDLLQGRDFTAADGPADARVAVVNRTMARRLWPGGGAVGETFRLGTGTGGVELRVVGVAEDARYRSLSERTPQFYYVPVAQWPNARMALFVRAAPGRATTARAAVDRLVDEVAPGVPHDPTAPLADRVAVGLLPQRVAAWVTGLCGALGLLLGAIGVYGVTSFTMRQRVREVGIRLAMGAGPGDVVRMLLRQGLWAPTLGAALGSLAGWGLGRALGAFLGGVSPADPAVHGTALAVLLGVAVVAALVPARRTAATDPSRSLGAD